MITGAELATDFARKSPHKKLQPAMNIVKVGPLFSFVFVRTRARGEGVARVPKVVYGWLSLKLVVGVGLISRYLCRYYKNSGWDAETRCQSDMFPFLYVL